MNKLETVIYDFVKSNPKLKMIIRNIYQSLFDLIPNKKNFFIVDPIIREGYFFGFHDLNQFSENCDKALVNKLTIPLRMPEPGDKLILGYLEGEKYDRFVEIARTKAWNYHKGCRLQWCGSNKKIIFNNFINNTYCSQVFDINAGHISTFDWPIDTVNSVGKLATTFDYSRLQTMMPGYGYINTTPLEYKNLDSVNEDGMGLVNLEENTKELIISLADLEKLDPSISMQGAKHFVSHSLFSEDDKYISFLHRWAKNDIFKIYTRLIVYSIREKTFYCSPTNDMVSHYVWNKDGSIIAYCRVGGIDSHILFEDFSLKKYKRVAYPRLNSDGHQSFNSNGNKIVTDTYPNRRRYSQLYIVNLDTDDVEMICDVKSLKKFQSIGLYKHWACDLHPRWNNEDTICFDSSHTGTRSVVFLKL